VIPCTAPRRSICLFTSCPQQQPTHSLRTQHTAKITGQTPANPTRQPPHTQHSFNAIILSPAATSGMGHAASHSQHPQDISLHRYAALTCSTLPSQAARAARHQAARGTQTSRAAQGLRAASRHGSPSHHRRPLHCAGAAPAPARSGGHRPIPCASQIRRARGPCTARPRPARRP